MPVPRAAVAGGWPGRASWAQVDLCHRAKDWRRLWGKLNRLQWATGRMGGRKDPSVVACRA